MKYVDIVNQIATTKTSLNFVKVSFSNETREYTYLSALALVPGDKLENANGKKITVKAVFSKTKAKLLPAYLKVLEDETFHLVKEKEVKNAEEGEIIKKGDCSAMIKNTSVTVKTAGIDMPAKIIKITKRSFNKIKTVIDGLAPLSMTVETCNELGKTSFPEKLYVKNIKYLGEEMVAAIVSAWRYGTKIGIKTPTGWEIFENKKPKRRFDVSYEGLNTMRIPSKLFNMKKNGRAFTDILADSRNLAKFIPHDAYDLIMEYNSMMYDKLVKYNKSVDFVVNNEFIKTLYKRLGAHKVGAAIDAVLYKEAQGEINFENFMKGVQVVSLSDEERERIDKLGNIYGCPLNHYYIHTGISRVIKNGKEVFASYPEIRMDKLAENERNSAFYDKKREYRNLTPELRDAFLKEEEITTAEQVKAVEETAAFFAKCIKEGTLTEEWVLSTSNLERCPKCGEIHRKDCKCPNCGYGIEEVSLSRFTNDRDAAMLAYEMSFDENDEGEDE